MTDATPKIFDVVIVGGGMVGTSIAAALCGADVQVALIEPNQPQQPPVELTNCAQYDVRVSAITAQSQIFLEKIGAWDLIPQQKLSPYTGMQVWDAEGTGQVEFSAAELHVDCLGTIVENRETVWALQQTINDCENIQQIREWVSHIDNQNDDGTTPLFLKNGEQLNARLIIGADGALSRVKQWAEFGNREWDYHHKAIVATVKTELSHQDTAWQRFRQQGPLALLPMAEANTCSIVWSTSEEECDAMLALSEDDFCQALSAAFESRLGRITEVGPRAAFPLRQRHAKNYVVPGIALVGDAAHTIHPLAGQGVNLGFKDAAALSEEIQRAVKAGISPGDISVLKRYERRRQGDNLAMMAVMESFKRLFAAEQPLLRWMRNEGMRLFNKASMVKQHVVMQAMGLR